MTSNPISDLQKQHSSDRAKYTYFLLAAAGAAIGFITQKTENVTLSWWLLPVALAILCWGISFICGCLSIEWGLSAMSSDIQFMMLKKGRHPSQPTDSESRSDALSNTKQKFNDSSKNEDDLAIWQFKLFVAGGAFFVLWRVTEILRLTYFVLPVLPPVN